MKYCRDSFKGVIYLELSDGSVIKVKENFIKDKHGFRFIYVFDHKSEKPLTKKLKAEGIIVEHVKLDSGWGYKILKMGAIAKKAIEATFDYFKPYHSKEIGYYTD